ncbi:(R)-mandelonitrile lyase 1 isoform X2 [Cannabis sativa]|uniref:(R)-mandelonitrile lyase 1 isoform X2 n=1 Tax=Cannabis sativa TaxID=3483 RepID=UPI0029CA5174|nr:(R)-mandelonitrile lyase 1 isoform X2 [Cannabis sativa]
MSLHLLTLLILLKTCFHGKLLAVQAVDYDFSYMKSVYNAIDLPLVEEYDYIVIGGGTAGCPLAATLSEKYSILVLERGNTPKAHPNVLSLSGFLKNFIEEDNGDTPAQRFISEDGVDNIRGRVLGGSSMVNGGFFSEADDDFFAKSGVEWDMNEVEKAYKWVKNKIVSYSNLSIWQSVVKQALLEVGIGPDNKVTTKHKIGTKQSGSIFDDMGRRHGAVELLNKGNLKNLRIAFHAYVNRIIFSTKSSNHHPTAIGVIYTDSKGRSHKALVHKKGEVILSAGALGSPQLLLLSGIGPKSYLSSQHIPIVLSQPNVGKFMADNPRNNLNLITPFPLESSILQVVGITKEYYIETLSYNLPFSPTTLPSSFFPHNYSLAIPPLQLSVANIVGKVAGPLSKGSLWLASNTDVKATPHVRFNYFSNPIDLERCVSMMGKFRDLLKTKSLDRMKYNDLKGNRDFLFYGPSLPTNQTAISIIKDYCRSSVTTFWHYHGGCQVGKVVDGDFKVIGIDSLRVVDGSTFITSPGTNPQATIMMIGRYLGLKMIRERQSRTRNLVKLLISNYLK